MHDHIRGHVFFPGVLVHCFSVGLHCTALLFWFLGLCIMLSSGKKGLPLVLSNRQISAVISVANITLCLDLAAVSHVGGFVACTLRYKPSVREKRLMAGETLGGMDEGEPVPLCLFG